MKLPRPGRPVRGSRSGRPVMALLDLLGRRMALRVLWELSRAEDALTFRALQAAAETNPGILNTRLKELRVAGIVRHDGDGYRLSDEGRALLSLLMPLTAWADAWSNRLGAAPGPSAAGRRAKVRKID